jgi:heme A synthase
MKNALVYFSAGVVVVNTKVVHRIGSMFPAAVIGYTFVCRARTNVQLPAALARLRLLLMLTKVRSPVFCFYQLL